VAPNEGQHLKECQIKKPKVITASDISYTLSQGLITREEIQKILDGWTPQKRGPKPDLITQANTLAVFELLRAEGETDRQAKNILMAKKRLIKPSSFDRFLDRCRSNWDVVFPPFDPDGKTRSIMLICKHRDHTGYTRTVSTDISQWTL